MEDSTNLLVGILKLSNFFNFRANNIQYDSTTDFNGKGEFHSVLNFKWRKERQKKRIMVLIIKLRNLALRVSRKVDWL